MIKIFKKSYSSLHNHSDFSNAFLGFPDSTCQLPQMIKRAKELNLNCVALTDHEGIGGHYKAKQLSKEYGIKCILGNEIYLQSDKDYEKSKQEYVKGETYYPHFILLALDEIGHKQLRELSNIAWRDNSYHSKGLLRRITKHSDVEKIIGNNKGHLYAQSACLGSKIGHDILKLIELEKNNAEKEKILELKYEVHNFIQWCCDTFGKDFFAIEIQPNEKDTEQWEYNIRAVQLAKAYNLLCVVTTDSHYLSVEQRPIHKAFLNSREEDDREVDSFYKTAYLMGYEEIYSYLKPNLGVEDTVWVLENTNIVSEKAKEYDLGRTQQIPQLKPPTFRLEHLLKNYYDKYEYIKKFAYDDEEQNRYLVYKIEQCAYRVYKDDNKYLPTIEIDENTGEEVIIRHSYTFEEMLSRIDVEFKELDGISQKLNQPLSSYYLTFSEIIKCVWDKAESLVGVSRGSGMGFLIAYLLDIIQINPLWYGDDAPHWRHASAERGSGLSDFDADFQPSKKDEIMKAMETLFGDENVLQVATFGTLSSKSAIKTSCRGLGYPVELAQSISDLVKKERGLTYSIKDCLYGDEEKGKKKIVEFVSVSQKYPDIIETALGLEGTIISKGEHASGVILSNSKYTNYTTSMRSSKGNLTTQFNLEDVENMGLIKYDFLLISALEKIRKTLEFLLENNKIEWQGNIKSTYFKYLNPKNLDYQSKKVWDRIDKIPFLFQFDTDVGKQALSMTKPKNIADLSNANNLMRLMGEFDGENNLQRFTRCKNDMNNWYSELKEKRRLLPDEVEVLKKHLFLSRGLASTQEKLMLLLMDKNISGFDLKTSDALRKVVSKKKVNQIAKYKNIFYESGKKLGTRKEMLDYVWDYQISISLGYSFSSLHSIAYSTIAIQEALLYTQFPPVYWATACLLIDGKCDEGVDNKSQDYGALASALYSLKNYDMTIKLPEINSSSFGFKPVEKDNSILFGLKAINSVNDEQARQIISNRPYTSLDDFLSKNKFPKKTIINLIKAGVFNEVENKKDKVELMKSYFLKIIESSKPRKDKLTLSNLPLINELGLLEENDKIVLRLYNFNKYITSPEFHFEKIKNKQWIIAKDIAKPFFEQYYTSEMEEDKEYKYTKDGIVFCKTPYNKLFKKRTGELLEKLNTNTFLNQYNERWHNVLLNEVWVKYCEGTKVDWEFQALSFYNSINPLSNVNHTKYNITNFSNIAEQPEIENVRTYKEQTRYEYRLYRLIGTVLNTDKNRHTVTLLTNNDEVVNVKMYDGEYNFYNKVIVEVNDNGDKETKDDSWLKRGRKILVTGFRNEDTFMLRKYSKSVFQETICLVEKIDDENNLKLKKLRYGQEEKRRFQS